MSTSFCGSTPKTLTKTAMLAESGATDMDFSLDGQWVIYAARENGTLWKSRIDGSNRMQLMAGATGAFAPHWSPDQKQILFTGFLLDKQPRLYVVSAQAVRLRRCCRWITGGRRCRATGGRMEGRLYWTCKTRLREANPRSAFWIWNRDACLRLRDPKG